MSADNSPPKPEFTGVSSRQERKAEKPYGLVGRIVQFVIVAAIGSAIAGYYWLGFAMGAGMSAGNGGAGSAPYLIAVLWIGGMIAATILIFKK